MIIRHPDGLVFENIDQGRQVTKKLSISASSNVVITERCMQDFHQAIERAFHLSYLLTASCNKAESAVMEGIEMFDPIRDSEETLVGYALRCALCDPDSAMHAPSVEIRAVFHPLLKLAANPRRCFVLRFLAGVPKETSARLLRMTDQNFDEYTRAALSGLAGFE